ncbi:MAG: greA [Dehalococcoidia bacterium]|nr:greA [Dehalococcoidia bacterium]
MEKTTFLTPEGHTRLKEELEFLSNVRRPEVVTKIHEAKERGGSSVTDAEYDDAKKEQGFIEGRIRTLEYILGNVTVIAKDDAAPGFVKLGTKVTVLNKEGDQEQFSIVGSVEASPRQGKISNESPVGHALLGRKIGEEIQVKVPQGLISYTVVAIE